MQNCMDNFYYAAYDKKPFWIKILESSDDDNNNSYNNKKHKFVI